MLNDSKKLSEKKREFLFDFIQEVAVDYSIIQKTPEEIDKINIWHARMNGFHEAINDLSIEPTQIIVDGNAFKPYYDSDMNLIPHICIEKGDGKYKSIAAASILAKVTHDRDIVKLHNEYPEYNWIKNKGYGTKEHINAIKEYGITKYHRKSFGICRQWKELPQKNIEEN
jgi:ribonuclease HII